MKVIVWICLLVAGVATAALGLLAFRDRPREKPEPPAARTPPPAKESPAPSEKPLRAYETTATLTEDLRDALAGPKEDLAGEVSRVSARLGPKARWILLNAAPAEASPRVRALLVLAAGLHVPDEEILLAFLDDREPLVRRAAALAAARAEGGRSVLLLEGVAVPVGRALPAPTRRAIEERLGREEDEGVRGTLAAALGPAGR